MKKLALILLSVMLVCGLAACGGDTSSGEPQKEKEEIVLYEDDVLKAIYKGVSDAGVLSVRLENKSDGEITVLPMDSSVNDTMIQFTSGMLATIQPGKSFNQGWLIGSEKAKKIEFSMSICDEHMSEITRTEILSIEVE